MPPIGISEIVLVVDDVARAAAFYRDVVRLIPRTEPTNEWAWFWAGKPGVNQQIALRRGTLLYEEFSPHPPSERFGHVHFAFEVPHSHLEAEVQRLREAGVKVYGPQRFEWMKADSYYFYDPDGNLLEFWSPG